MNWFAFCDILKAKLESGEIKDEDTCVSPVIFSGPITAADGKKRKNTKATILVPVEICNTDLRELRKWDLRLFAIKKDAYDIIMEEQNENVCKKIRGDGTDE